jgi:hypothetical protein
LKFPQVATEPLLLKSGEVLEDTDEDGARVVTRTKKATTRKTATSQKQQSEDGKQE